MAYLPGLLSTAAQLADFFPNQNTGLRKPARQAIEEDGEPFYYEERRFTGSIPLVGKFIFVDFKHYLGGHVLRKGFVTALVMWFSNQPKWL